jgi:hypothetical protein
MAARVERPRMEAVRKVEDLRIMKRRIEGLVKVRMEFGSGAGKGI